MTFINNLTANPDDQVVKVQWQPQFPLEYDTVFGPYKPITSEIESIQQNFKNLLLTNPGEWPMNPQLGIGLRSYLFENFDSPKLEELKRRTLQQLERYLPSVTLYDVKFYSSDQEKDEGYLKVSFIYSIFGSSFVETVLSVDPSRGIHAAITNTHIDTDVFLAGARALASGVRQASV